MFTSLKQPIFVVELDKIGKEEFLFILKVENGAEIQKELATLTGQTTVPNVFIKGTHLGGCSDTEEANESGRLAQLLK